MPWWTLKSQDGGRNRPVSYLTQFAIRREEESNPLFGKFHENHVKRIAFFMKEVMKIHNYQLKLQYQYDKLIITVHVYLDNGSEVFIKPRNPDIMDNFNDFVGMPWATIEFARHGTKVSGS